VVVVAPAVVVVVPVVVVPTGGVVGGKNAPVVVEPVVATGPVVVAPGLVVVAVDVEPVVVVSGMVVSKQSSLPKPASAHRGLGHRCARVQRLDAVVAESAAPEADERAAKPALPKPASARPSIIRIAAVVFFTRWCAPRGRAGTLLDSGDGGVSPA
jgi:hypothetical protein